MPFVLPPSASHWLERSNEQKTIAILVMGKYYGGDGVPPRRWARQLWDARIIWLRARFIGTILGRETERSTVMKVGRPLLLSAFFSLITFSMIAASRGSTLTFDDLVDTHAGGGTLITNRYQSLIWSNFAARNAVLETAHNGLSRYY